MPNSPKLLLVLCLSIAFSLFTVSCGTESQGPVEKLDNSELIEENKQLKGQIHELDSMISRVGFGSKLLNSNLDSINKLEEELRFEMQSRNNDSVLLEKVKDISSLVSVNRSIIQDLKDGMDDRNLSTKLLLDMIIKLDDRIKAKEGQIGVLNKSIDQLGEELSSLLDNYASLETDYDVQAIGLQRYKQQIQTLQQEIENKDEVITDKDALLNKAFYFFGSKKELTTMGIIKKSGVFNKEINEDFDLSVLNKVDIRSFKELKIPAGKVKVLSDHPNTSFKLKSGINSSKLSIKNPTEFWSVSKTLIIQVD